jgi:prolipoprotein diacylglyceryl transferase
MAPLSIPSPAQGVWHLGPVPLRAYALCIIAGIIVAVWMGERRWVARGGRTGDVTEIATWMVPFGILGGRIYHVITTPQPYFGNGGHPLHALYIWQGGLGIWGAIALGGLGAWIGCRRRGIRLPPFADALAPGIAVAQAIGRLGNFVNQELFGRPTDLPWGLEIDQAHRPDGYATVATYHPTFAYELLWDLGVAGLVIWADRRFRLGHGRAFALYVAAYTVGRAWIEALRIDPANDILGLRLNLWTCLVLFLGAVTYFVVSSRLRPGRETVVRVEPGSADDAAGGTPTDETPTDETPTDETPTDETPTDETPTDETPTDETPTDETPTDETPTDETPTDETPTDETPTDETPTDETSSDETPSDETPTDETPTDGSPSDEEVRA